MGRVISFSMTKMVVLMTGATGMDCSKLELTDSYDGRSCARLVIFDIRA